jgi:hypothetical protein
MVTITGVSLTQAKPVGISGKSASFTLIDDTTVFLLIPAV